MPAALILFRLRSTSARLLYLVGIAVVPDADAGDVGAVFFEQGEKVLRLAASR